MYETPIVAVANLRDHWETVAWCYDTPFPADLCSELHLQRLAVEVSYSEQAQGNLPPQALYTLKLVL